MKAYSWRVILGVFLMLLGVVYLLQSFRILPISGEIWQWFFAVLFVVVGGSFIYALLQDHNKWWAAIPGVTLVGLGGTIALSSVPVLENFAGAVFLGSIGLSFLIVYFFRRNFWWTLFPGIIMLGLAAMVVLTELKLGFINDNLATSIFLGSIGLSFLIIYLIKKDYWWALIPGGTMLSVALLVGLDNVAYLFLGLALTFGALAMLPIGGRRMTWAWIPAIVLLVMGVIFYVSTALGGTVGNYIFPAVLIVVGIYLLYRAFYRR